MFPLRTVCSRSLPAARRVEEAIEKEARALHTTVSRRAGKDPKAEETAKKYVGKIHEEEANKEKHPSPVSPAAQEKLTEMERKAQEHDQKKKQK